MHSQYTEYLFVSNALAKFHIWVCLNIAFRSPNNQMIAFLFLLPLFLCCCFSTWLLAGLPQVGSHSVPCCLYKTYLILQLLEHEGVGLLQHALAESGLALHVHLGAGLAGQVCAVDVFGFVSKLK